MRYWGGPRPDLLASDDAVNWRERFALARGLQSPTGLAIERLDIARAQGPLSSDGDSIETALAQKNPKHHLTV